MFNFYVENDEPFGSVTKNCLQLDKNESIVSTFSVFVVYKSVVSTIQKNNSAYEVPIFISECICIVYSFWSCTFFFYASVIHVIS